MSDAVNLLPAASESLIYSRLRAGGIPDPLAKLTTAQSGHETDGWISDVYRRLDNAFGYGYNGKTYKNYLTSGGVESSVDDLIAYLNRRVTEGDFPPLDQIQTARQYADLLDSVGYFEDTPANYAAGLSRWFNNNLAYIGGGSLLLVIFVFLLLFRKGRKD